MILERYNHFNTEEYIKSLKPLRKRRTKLALQLESLSEIPAIGNSPPAKTSSVSDLTGNLAIKRSEIEAELADIELALSAYEYAKSRLPAEEREIIELFFESRKPIWRAVDDYVAKHYTYRGNVYKMRRLALEKMESIIAGKYLK